MPLNRPPRPRADSPKTPTPAPLHRPHVPSPPARLSPTTATPFPAVTPYTAVQSLPAARCPITATPRPSPGPLTPLTLGWFPEERPWTPTPALLKPLTPVPVSAANP